MKNKYNKTMTACFTGYIVQAIVNNFVPLLFLTFQRSYDIPLSQITALVTFNFGVQLLVDLLSIGFVDKIGYRASMVIAHIMSAAGLLLLTVLPEVMPPFALQGINGHCAYNVGSRASSFDCPAGGDAAFCRYSHFRNGVCDWRRTSGSAGKPCCGILPF